MNETRMGGACSMQRHTSSTSSSQRQDSSSPSNSNRNYGRCGGSTSSSCLSPGARRFSRHSVVSELPDESIWNLYPLDDNYVLEDSGLRSPKSLAELCTDTLCRSLPYLDGSLPKGVPQDIVDDVVASLVKHSALNATTLRVLRNCELGSLTLAGCRGVTDDWLEPLSSSGSNTEHRSIEGDNDINEDDTLMEVMDLDDYDAPLPSSPGNTHDFINDPNHHQHNADIFYNASLEEASAGNSNGEEASCSTSSFVSASSNLYTATVADQETRSSTTNIKGEYYCPMLEESTSPPPTVLEKTASGLYHDDGYMSLTDHDVSSSSSPSYFHLSPRQKERASSITSNITLLDLRGSQRLTDKGLLKLSDLSSLEVAKMDNCYSIQGRGLLALSLSHRLRSLSLANCRRLTDEAIINISHLVSLEELSLSGCRCLTDRSLVAINTLIQIKKLDLSQCDLITDGGLEELEELDQIEELSLGWCRSISDNGIKTICRHPGRTKALRVLSLARIPVTDEGVSHLGKLQALEELDLNGCSNIGSVSLGAVLSNLTKLISLDVSSCPGILRSSWQGKISSLKTLEACYSGVRDSHLSRLTNLPALEEINLDSCPVGDWAISHLADNCVVPNLTSLDLADTDLSDLGMIHIGKFKKLKRLSLFYCNLTNSSLRHLSKLENLEILNLDSREIGDSGLWHLGGLKNLKSLDIFSGRITDTGCSHIAQIKTLESLELCGGGITDTGCTILAGLENLTTLNLSQNERITNRGAAALAALSNLKTLNLSNTRVNSEALIHFSDLRNLKSLALYGCRGIDEANNIMLDRLQSGLPNLKCIRLNNGPDDDGVISTSEEDSDEEDLDSDSEQVVFSTNYSHRRALAAASAPFEDTDSDSEMEDAPARVSNGNHDEDGSESSFSDHDY